MDGSVFPTDRLSILSQQMMVYFFFLVRLELEKNSLIIIMLRKLSVLPENFVRAKIFRQIIIPAGRLSVLCQQRIVRLYFFICSVQDKK